MLTDRDRNNMSDISGQILDDWWINVLVKNVKTAGDTNYDQYVGYKNNDIDDMQADTDNTYYIKAIRHTNNRTDNLVGQADNMFGATYKNEVTFLRMITDDIGERKLDLTSYISIDNIWHSVISINNRAGWTLVVVETCQYSDGR